MNKDVQSVLTRYHTDKTRLIDILWDFQRRHGYVSEEVVGSLSDGLNMSCLDIRETLSFYHFFHEQPTGKHRIYLSNTVIARMGGYENVRAALVRETGCVFGGVDESGTFGLYDTQCIGLSDQEPAMLVDDVVFTNLTAARVGEIVSQLRRGETAVEIANADALASTDVAYVDALVADNIQQKGPVFFQKNRNYSAILACCLESLPDEVIELVTSSGLRGYGGAGFPTGLKWGLCREAEGEEKYIICNADEGEPGTYKDRALLTRSPRDVLLGMIIAAYAVGSRHGIIYLRAEYGYLNDYLEQQLTEFRSEGLLGKSILKFEFEFDIRIQMGAGAYICGEETALIESCEGKRGTPRVKPPYPIQQGYLGMPTSVNNVETFAAVGRILEEGSAWFNTMGTDASKGTRLLSVSGDCDRPGIYELEWGVTLNEVLHIVGANDPRAVQISGPSGECASVKRDGERVLCFSDLACNGSFMIFDQSRDLLDIVRQFMEFFVKESCGICVPCRAGGVDLYHKTELLIAGRATQKDLDDIVKWGGLMRSTSRCGLGTTAPRPLLTTLEKFPEIYRGKIVQQQGPLLPSFDLDTAFRDYDRAHQLLIVEEVRE